jgi:hypothetical protein
MVLPARAAIAALRWVVGLCLGEECLVSPSDVVSPGCATRQQGTPCRRLAGRLRIAPLTQSGGCSDIRARVNYRARPV